MKKNKPRRADRGFLRPQLACKKLKLVFVHGADNTHPAVNLSSIRKHVAQGLYRVTMLGLIS